MNGNPSPTTIREDPAIRCIIPGSKIIFSNIGSPPVAHANVYSCGPHLQQ
jgi:hypothetical protein